MKNKLAKRTCINVAVMESDPLRFAGFKAVLDSEPDLHLKAVTLTEIGNAQGIDVVLVAGRSGQSAFRDIEMLRATRSDLRILVTGSCLSDSTMLDALACGAKGYVDEAGSVQDFVKAIRIVADGLIWAPRRVLATFIERSSHNSGRGSAADRNFTSREKEVLELLVQGTPNKDIGRSLGIEERTVKAHVAKLMRKAGVQNRILLSVHALNHGLVASSR
jgi:DNA-binding NarL/FixJ family response regulator